MIGCFLMRFLSQSCGDLIALNSIHRDNLPGHMGIYLTAIGPDFIRGEMPVDARTVQPFGMLHGGASIVLAETLGSVASWLLVSHIEGARVAGIEVSGSHLRSVNSGKVKALCKPLRIGRTLHFWQVDVRDEAGRLCCAARLTVSVNLPGPDTLAC